jgi:hypothetical protein
MKHACKTMVGRPRDGGKPRGWVGGRLGMGKGAAVIHNLPRFPPSMSCTLTLFVNGNASFLFLPFAFPLLFSFTNRLWVGEVSRTRGFAMVAFLIQKG